MKSLYYTISLFLLFATQPLMATAVTNGSFQMATQSTNNFQAATQSTNNLQATTNNNFQAQTTAENVNVVQETQFISSIGLQFQLDNLSLPLNVGSGMCGCNSGETAYIASCGSNEYVSCGVPNSMQCLVGTVSPLDCLSEYNTKMSTVKGICGCPTGYFAEINESASGTSIQCQSKTNPAAAVVLRKDGQPISCEYEDITGIASEVVKNNGSCKIEIDMNACKEEILESIAITFDDTYIANFADFEVNKANKKCSYKGEDATGSSYSKCLKAYNRIQKVAFDLQPETSRAKRVISSISKVKKSKNITKSKSSSLSKKIRK